MTKNILLVAIGGGSGSVLRYLTSILTNKFFPSTFPWPTFIVNIVGCLIVGILFGLFYKSNFTNPDLKILFVTGFCGGFTTFSTFALESNNLIQTNNVALAIIYTVASILFGLAFIWVGLLITK